MTDNYEIDAPTLVKFRAGDDHSRPHLWICKPDTLMKATLDSLPVEDPNSNTVAELAITVIMGSAGDVLRDMTCLVMDPTEAILRGIVRVRKAPTSSILYIEEDNNDRVAKWFTGDHLVILDDFLIRARHLRTPSSDVVYVDWDIGYTDQHTHPEPSILFDPPVRIVEWNIGDELDIVIANASAVVPFGDDTIAAWLWETSSVDATISDETTDTPTVHTDATGRIQLRCTVTTSADKSWTRCMYIEVVGPGREPIDDFVLTAIPTGPADQGGWNFSVRINSGVTKNDVRDRALVVLFSDDWYSNIKESFGPVPGAENIVAWGWISRETIDWSADEGPVTFEVQGPAHLAQLCQAFPQGVMDTDYANNGGGDPTKFVTMKELSVDKALWTVAHERSTFDRVCDVYYTGDTRQAPVITATAENLWSQLVNMAYNTIGALPICDRYNRLKIQVDQQFLPMSARGALPTVMALTKDDHYKVSIVRRSVYRFSQAKASGVLWLNGSYASIGAIAPGNIPLAPAEGPWEQSEMVMGTQDDALEFAGLVAGSGAGEIESAQIEIPQNNRFFDIAEHMWVTISIAEADTSRGVVYTDKRLVIRQVGLPWDEAAGVWSVSLECVGEGVQLGAIPMKFPGEGEPPATPPVEPPTNPPPPPTNPPPPPEPGEGDAVVATSADVRTTADLSAETPTWTTEL